MENSQQETALAALSVACEQPAFISDPSVLCTAAATGMTLGRLLRQGSACHMAVVLPLNLPYPRLFSFAQWLPKHAALVKSLDIMAQEPAPEHMDGLNWELHMGAGMVLLHQAVQLAAAEPAAAAEAAVGQQQLRGLRLGSFSSNWRGTLQLLAALPAHSLTQLTLDLGWPVPPKAARALANYGLDGAVTSAALGRLSSLQQLTLANSDGRCKVRGDCLADVVQLTQLTLLDLTSFKRGDGWEDDDDGDDYLLELLPRLPQLRVLRLPAGWARHVWPALDFSHMTQLQELTNSGGEDSNRFSAEQRFPAHLQQLGFGAMDEPQQLATVAQLQHLQGLTLLLCSRESSDSESADSEAADPQEERRDLVQMLQPLTAQMPALKKLSFQYCDPWLPERAAVTWAQLPQLCEVVVHDAVYGCEPEAWETILRGVAAATSLTKLELCLKVGIDVPRQEPGEAVAACSALAGLTKLADLRMRLHLLPGDALALSGLTGLTRLVLAGAGSGVGDEAAAAIARSCRQLRHLDFSKCSLGSGAACLAEIGQLTQLRQLRLEGNAGVTRQGLMQLTGLVQLRQLGVDRQGDVNDAAVESFWAAVAAARRRWRG